MTFTAKSPYAGYRFPGEVISHAVWLYLALVQNYRLGLGQRDGGAYRAIPSFSG